MNRIVLSFLVILLINEEGSAFLSKEFIDIKSAISWGDLVLEKVSSYYKMIRKLDNPSKLTLDQIFTEVDKTSDKYETFLSIVAKKHTERFKVAIDSHQNRMSPHYYWSSQLNYFINTVNSAYNDARSRNFKIDGRTDNKTLEDYYAQFVLMDSLSVPTALDKIYQQITVLTHSKSLFKRLAINDVDKITRLHVCDKYISDQQSMISIYVNLLVTEMKGLTTLTYVYSLLQSLNKSTDYTVQLQTVGRTFKKHINKYNDNVKKAIASLPREIHRCDVNPPQRDINFIEFVYYNRVELVSASTLASETPGELFNFCNTQCEDINYSFMESFVGLKIYNVQTVGYNDEVEICLLDIRPHRSSLWWKIQGQIFGHYETCPNTISFADLGWLYLMKHCHTCQCSVIKTVQSNSNDILRISISPQISDIKNNMVVVGVKFVTHENAVHFQIQQGKYLPGEIINNATAWKKIDDNHQSDVIEKFDYEMLSDFSGQLYLDDVILPSKYVVTGVRFRSRKNTPEGFYLELHGTQINLQTGQLIPDSSDWFVAGNRDSAKTSDYTRDRIEIKITDPDDPSRCSEYDYDSETNKFIQFVHSSVTKDAGQSTVPYIDAQPVETYPSYPLSGIGLFYRGKIGCGGYIAPRIFTFDVSL